MQLRIAELEKAMPLTLAPATLPEGPKVTNTVAWVALSPGRLQLLARAAASPKARPAAFGSKPALLAASTAAASVAALCLPVRVTTVAASASGVIGLVGSAAAAAASLTGAAA